MRGTWSLTRCPAPTSTRGGVLRCVVRRDACPEPTHRRWDRLTPALAVVWWLRPWWPNALGRAQDRGTAHTCPTVLPCRACHAPRVPCTVTTCDWWVETDTPTSSNAALRDHLRRVHHEYPGPPPPQEPPHR